METIFLQDIKEKLTEKRRNLALWLETTPAGEKDIHLGPAGEEAVEEHIHVIDETLDKVGSGALGICKICGEPVDDELLEMDYTARVCLSHLTPEEAQPLERELELSRMIQRALLPQDAPQFPGLDLAAFLRPAQIVGGDFFDFQRFKDGRYSIVIADVVGKGFSASLIMSSMQMALRALIPESDSPAGVLSRINGLFAHNIHFTIFVTLVLGAYDPSRQIFTYCNAGHNPPLLCRRQDGSDPAIARLNPSGTAIGLLENPPFKEETVSLHRGDLLLFYTDGVPEAFGEGEEQYGMDRLEELIRRKVDSSPKNIIRHIQNDLQAFMGNRPPSDDITMIAGRVLLEQ